ncbi:MAG: CHAD domain-containing protein [Deltaproteobacteria bacterium]|nr:CHAD domain-containing protein [Deltaproteobacteria bacterium]
MATVIQNKTTQDKAFVRFGIQSLLEQLYALTKEIDGVMKADDPEYVHRMRVASRRIRTRLGLFGSCLPGKKAALWNRHFRKVTKALGAARDTDVQIIFVESFLAECTGREKDGVKRLHLRLVQKRRRIQKKVCRAMTRITGSGVIHDMEETLRTALSPFLIEDDKGSPEYGLRAAREEISARLADMLGFVIYIHDPARKLELHEMRIAVKHLRYSMEAFEPLYGKELKGFIKTTKTLQEMLGDIHDCDVWTEFLPEFYQEERQRALEYTGGTRPAGRLKKGIECLEMDRAGFREERYHEFVSCWEENKEQWKELLDVLARQAQSDQTVA